MAKTPQPKDIVHALQKSMSPKAFALATLAPKSPSVQRTLLSALAIAEPQAAKTMVDTAISLGASVHYRVDDQSPLAVAIKNNNGMLSHLYALGVDFKAPITSTNGMLRTPIWEAIHRLNAQAISFILSKNVPLKNTPTPGQFLTNELSMPHATFMPLTSALYIDPTSGGSHINKTSFDCFEAVLNHLKSRPQDPQMVNTFFATPLKDLHTLHFEDNLVLNASHTLAMLFFDSHRNLSLRGFPKDIAKKSLDALLPHALFSSTWRLLHEGSKGARWLDHSLIDLMLASHRALHDPLIQNPHAQRAMCEYITQNPERIETNLLSDFYQILRNASERDSNRSSRHVSLLYQSARASENAPFLSLLDHYTHQFALSVLQSIMSPLENSAVPQSDITRLCSHMMSPKMYKADPAPHLEPCKAIFEIFGIGAHIQAVPGVDRSQTIPQIITALNSLLLPCASPRVLEVIKESPQLTTNHTPPVAPFIDYAGKLLSATEAAILESHMPPVPFGASSFKSTLKV